MSPGGSVAAGPVERALIGFPGDRFDEAIIAALAELVDTGTVRLIDVVVVKVRTTGRAAPHEIAAGKVVPQRKPPQFRPSRERSGGKRPKR